MRGHFFRFVVHRVRYSIGQILGIRRKRFGSPPVGFVTAFTWYGKKFTCIAVAQHYSGRDYQFEPVVPRF